MQRLTILILLCAAALAAADFGPPIGSRLNKPDVRLGPKGAAILFDASKAQAAELEARREAFRKLGAEVQTLSGPGAGWFVLDAKGVIVAKYLDGPYTPAAILVHQFGWAPPDTTQVEGRQLSATIGASDSAVAPGERVALIIDVDLAPNMHVYAPGVDGYIPIEWKMEDSSAIEAQAPVFPRAEKLYLKAIDETVPAYRNHFRLIRDITMGAGSAGAITLEGTLRYQACDDRVCYIPQTLHLKWSFKAH
jgi:hypothetical protein